MEQYLKVAGLSIKLNSFGRTERQAKAYEIQPCHDLNFTVHSDIADIEKVKEKFPGISDENAEYLFTGACFYKHLLEFDGMMLHSSAVVVDNRAYLFSANCGTGKSTHTGLWLKVFGKRAYILNDDKPALRREKDGWFAYGTPWSGKCDMSVDRRVPLAGIAVLERGEQNEISPYSGIHATHDILAQVNRPSDRKHRELLMNLLDQLITEVPVWKLKCNMDPSAVITSYEAMSGEKFTK